MKKIDNNAHKNLLVVLTARLARRRRRKHNPPKRLKLVEGQAWIRFPRELGISNGLNIQPFIKRVQMAGRIRGTKIILDLSAVEKINAAAMILLHANVASIINRRGGDVAFRLRLPIEDKACQVLKQIGFLDCIGYDEEAEIIPCEEDVVHWHATSGFGAEGAKYDAVVQDYLRTRIPGQFDSKLYNSVSEAMTNVSQHAYLDLHKPDREREYKPWWMFSQIKDDVLTVVFCDLGVGIPRTLPIRYSKLKAKLLATTAKSSGDGKAIAIAIKESISRTKKSHRGRGLGQITSSIIDCEGGKVIVFSNKGYYERSNGVEKPRYGSIKDSIGGTIISWQVPLLTTESEAAA
ncbi:hypothetical protein [Zhongshania sp.]|jgi:hypothetical protein|uniref:hypothetical protein n=1 Tax=Zhongshania sp. TaxID=1971902 RepID=UPI002A81210D|nr:hypothetical protein [Zhongshania sp.]